MIQDDSPFRRLPKNLNPKQVLFLDGIRHSAEISSLAYTRLCKTLMAISVVKDEDYPDVELFTHAFLDAWAMVDALHRFICLWNKQPKADTLPSSFRGSALQTKLKNIRELRNVSAHIAERMDHVLAKKGSALGTLKWVHARSQSPPNFRSYALIPGSFVAVKLQLTIPTKPFTKPIGCVSLVAGEYTGNLSNAYGELKKLIVFAEHTLNAQFPGSPKPQDVHGTDLIAKVDLN